MTKRQASIYLAVALFSMSPCLMQAESLDEAADASGHPTRVALGNPGGWQSLAGTGEAHRLLRGLVVPAQ